MDRLFYRVFLWFWLSIIVVSITLVALTAIRHSRSSEDEHWRDKYGPRVDLWARQETHILDHDGISALTKYVKSFESDPGVRNYLFGDNEQELLGRQAPAVVLRTVSSMTQSHRAEEQFFAGDRLIAEKTVGTTGSSYVVVVTFPQPSILRRPLWQFLGEDIGRDGIVRLGAILLIAGLFCFWLAQQIISPIGKLRLATREIANEHLNTRVDGSVTSRRDELAELGRDFNRMAQRIDELVMAHRRLVTDVSHTLRSPLARLNVALGLARQRTAPEASRHLDRIEREADRLNTLIGQLLTLARIDSDVDPQRKVVFDLATLVQEVAADGDYEARGRGCTVTFAPCHECLLEGIPEMLRVAIENVIRNAVRHTAEGTDVQIGIELQSAKGNRQAVIQVLDHGPGVPEEELASIFLPFHRSAEGICRDPDGAGLGLAITERAFRFHGGTTAAANNPAGGLVVTLELPLLDSRCRTKEVSQRGSHGVGMPVPLGEGVGYGQEMTSRVDGTGRA
jgi:signal transduction histidine kinase